MREKLLQEMEEQPEQSRSNVTDAKGRGSPAA